LIKEDLCNSFYFAEGMAKTALPKKSGGIKNLNIRGQVRQVISQTFFLFNLFSM